LIDVKQATKIALEYFETIPGYESYAESSRIEEVELDENERYWYITLGYPVPVEKSPFDLITVGSKSVIHYKIIKIDSNSGKVYSMKMRSV